MSLRWKLMMIIIVFLCLPFLTVLYLWVQNSSAAIERTAADFGKLLVRQTGDYIDMYMRDLERDTVPLLVLSSIKEFMNLDSRSEFEYYELVNEIEEDLRTNVFYKRYDIIGVQLISAKGGMHRFGFYNDNNWRDMYQKGLDLRTPERTYNVGDIVFDNFGAPAIAYYRYYSDFVYRDVRDMIIIYLNLSRVLSINSNTVMREAGYLWIADSGGNYIHHPDSALVGKKVDPALIRQSSGNVFEFIQNGPDGKKLIVQQRSDYTGWTLVYEIPLTVLSEELLSLQRITTVVIVCLIGFALIVLGGFAYRMTRRIMFLQKLMYQAEWGGLDVKIPIDGRGRDEIGKLYRGLNNLLAEIRRLIGELQASRDKEKELRMREKESMIQIMQSQINPHFLYNTLEVINSHAILQGYKPISSMALSLSRMLRYSVSNHEHIVSLAEEAKHIRWYCNILQQRCETLRTVILMDEDAARSVACVRLTLQPLVENAFLHGYEKLGRDPEWIEVTGERNGEDYIVRIADGGQGMSMEQIKHYNEAFAISSPLSGELPSSIQGVGLWNVHRRIRLTFGETYGLHIEESTNVGTAILIRLPAGAFQTNS